MLEALERRRDPRDGRPEPREKVLLGNGEGALVRRSASMLCATVAELMWDLELAF